MRDANRGTERRNGRKEMGGKKVGEELGRKDRKEK